MHGTKTGLFTGPARGFLYMAVAVELVEPSVGISLQYATQACKMGLRVDTFSVRAVSEPHCGGQR